MVDGQQEIKTSTSAELAQLMEMPGWAHLIKVRDAILNESLVSPRDIHNLNDRAIAYKAGLQDGLKRFFQAIEVNINHGNATYQRRLKALSKTRR